MNKCALTVAVAFVAAILCLLQTSPAVAMPPNRAPGTITGIISGGGSNNGNKNNNNNNVSFFKRVVQKSVALVLFPLFITLEIIWNSTGQHSDVGSLADDEATDTRIHVTCATILKLWTDLRTMEQAQKVYLEAIDDIVNAEVLNANETYPDIVDKIDKAYAEEPTLGKLYTRLRAETDRELTIPSDHRQVELALNWRDRDSLLYKTVPLGARMLLFKFHSELQNTGDNNALAKTILAVSKDADRYEKMQKIFEQTLKDVGPSFGVSGTDEQAAALMFKNLKKNIADDAELKAVFEKHKISLR